MQKWGLQMERKDEILEAAFKLFALKGYNTSMSDIASQVGIKVPSLYNHFESKDDIIYLVIETEAEYYYSGLQTFLDELSKESYEKRLQELFYRICSDFKEPERVRFWKNISMIYNEELRGKCRELVKEREWNLYDRISKDFQKASQEGFIKSENLEGSIFLFFSMVQGVLDMLLITQSEAMKQERFYENVWNAFWNGIKI